MIDFQKMLYQMEFISAAGSVEKIIKSFFFYIIEPNSATATSKMSTISNFQQ